MFGLDDWIARLGGSGVMAFVVALLLGLRHATDPDHLTAVSTLFLGSQRDGPPPPTPPPRPPPPPPARPRLGTRTRAHPVRLRTAGDSVPPLSAGCGSARRRGGD